MRLLFALSFASLTACPADDMQAPPPDAKVVQPDAKMPPPPPPKLPYGATCTSADQCQSGLCVGETGGTYMCS